MNQPIERDGRWIIQKTGWYKMTPDGPVLLEEIEEVYTHTSPSPPGQVCTTSAKAGEVIGNEL